MMCEHNEETEDLLVKHLADVHNLHDTTDKDEQEVTKFNCALCDHSDDTEMKLVKHLEVVHELVDWRSKRTTYQTSSNQSKTNQSMPTCENGPSCRYLRQYRCRYYHKEAAQPEEEWEEVRPRNSNNRSQWQHNKHHNNQINNNQHRNEVQQISDSCDGVQWCRQEMNCTRGRKCKYRHPEGRPGFVIQRRNFAQTMGDFIPARDQRLRM